MSGPENALTIWSQPEGEDGSKEGEVSACLSVLQVSWDEDAYVVDFYVPLESPDREWSDADAAALAAVLRLVSDTAVQFGRAAPVFGRIAVAGDAKSPAATALNHLRHDIDWHRGDFDLVIAESSSPPAEAHDQDPWTKLRVDLAAPPTLEGTTTEQAYAIRLQIIATRESSRLAALCKRLVDEAADENAPWRILNSVGDDCLSEADAAESRATEPESGDDATSRADSRD